MPIAVSCPSCGLQTTAPDEFAGRRIRCKHCRAEWVAGRPGVVPEEELPPKATAGRKGQPPVRGAAGTGKSSASLPIMCPTCNTVMNVPAGMMGKRISCTRCNRPFDAVADGGTVADLERRPPSSRARQPTALPAAIDRNASHEPADRGRAEKECPYCGELVAQKAKKCKHCGEVMDPLWREAEDREARRDRRRRQVKTESDTDVPGVIGLVLGILAIVCVVMGCFTCGMTYFAAAPLAAVGAACSAFGQGNRRVAGLALNIITLIPAIALFVMTLLGMGAAIAP